MPERAFQQIDVFSQRPGDGNPLAVVLDAQGLSDADMQRFATWANLSETTYLLPPTEAGLAAGATVWGYCPWEGGHTTPEALLAAGAQRVLRDMAELPGLLRH